MILVLLAPGASGRGAGLLLGWTGGIGLATGVTLLAVEVGDVDGDRATAAAGWLQLAVGVLLVAVGLRHWVRRRRPDEPAPDRAWMAAIGTLTPARGAVLGLVLCAANPKILTLCLAAGAAVAGRDLPAGQNVLAVLAFTAVAASTVAVPVAGYAVGAERMRGPLDRLGTLLHRVSGTALAVLLVALGVLLAGNAANGLL